MYFISLFYQFSNIKYWTNYLSFLFRKHKYQIKNSYYKKWISLLTNLTKHLILAHSKLKIVILLIFPSIMCIATQLNNSNKLSKKVKIRHQFKSQNPQYNLQNRKVYKEGSSLSWKTKFHLKHWKKTLVSWIMMDRHLIFSTRKFLTKNR